MINLLDSKGVQIEQLSEDTFKKITDEVSKYSINPKLDDFSRLKMNYRINAEIDRILKEEQYQCEYITANDILSEVYDSLFDSDTRNEKNADTIIKHFKKDFFDIVTDNKSELSDISRLKNTVETRIFNNVNFKCQLPSNPEKSTPAETIEH